MATAEALTGPTTPDGARVQVHNAPGAEVGPGQVATWGHCRPRRRLRLFLGTVGEVEQVLPVDWSGPDQT